MQHSSGLPCRLDYVSSVDASTNVVVELAMAQLVPGPYGGFGHTIETLSTPSVQAYASTVRFLHAS